MPLTVLTLFTALGYYIVESGLVSTAIGLSEKSSIRATWRGQFCRKPYPPARYGKDEFEHCTDSSGAGLFHARRVGKAFRHLAGLAAQRI